MFKSNKDKNSKEKEREKEKEQERKSNIEDKIFPRIKANDASLAGVRVKILFPQVACKFFKLLKDNTKCQSVAAQQLTIDEDVGKEISNCLQANKTITFLSFPECSLKGEGLKELSKGLKMNKTLMSLSIGPERSASGMNEAGIDAVLAALMDLTPTLTKLELISLRLPGTFARPLAKLLHKNVLRTLNIARNPIGDEGYQQFCAVLPRVTSLKALILDNTLPSALSAQQLFMSLKPDTCQLIRLSLNGVVAFDSSVISTLSETLSHVKTLKELELSGCKLGTELASSLLQMLSQNVTLRRLDISDNDIRDITALELEHCHVISELNLAGNHLNDDALTQLAQQLPYNRSLHRLNLQRNDFTTERVRQQITAELLEQTCLQAFLVGQPSKVTKDKDKDGSKTDQSVNDSFANASVNGSADDGQRLTDAALQVLARTASLYEAKLKWQDERNRTAVTWDQVTTWPGIIDAAGLGLSDKEAETMLYALQRTDPGQFAAVHTVRLFDNRLTGLRCELLESLPRGLTRLEAARNSICEIATTAMTNLTRLAMLDVRCNVLEYLPEAVTVMPSLRQLLVSQNRIAFLPRVLLQRPDVELHLAGNLLPQRLLLDLRNGPFATATLSTAGERDLADLLLKYDASNDFAALRAILPQLSTNDNEQLLLGMIPMIEFMGASQSLIPVLLQLAVQLSDRPSTCLRSDGPELFLVTKYMSSVSAAFLERTVKPVVERILDAGKLPIVLEPTPGEESNPKENVNGLTSLLFDLLSKNMDSLPMQLQTVVINCYIYILAKWTTTAKDAAQGLAVACTLFLRLITPALISPDVFGLVSAKQVESKSKRKNLLTVAKHLQTQASRAFEENNRVRQLAIEIFARPISIAPSAQLSAPRSKDLEAYGHELAKYCQANCTKLGELLGKAKGPVPSMLHVLFSLNSPLPPIAMLSAVSRRTRRQTGSGPNSASNTSTPSGKTLQAWSRDAIPPLKDRIPIPTSSSAGNPGSARLDDIESARSGQSSAKP